MDERRWVGFLVVAGLGLTLGVQMPGVWSPSKSQSSSSSAPNGPGARVQERAGVESPRISPEHHLWILGRFYGIELEFEKSEKSGEAAATRLSAAVRGRITDRVLKSNEGDKHVRFLIASIPDPRDSHLSNFSDDFLEAIQRGVQKSGYQFDSHWLPWPLNALREADAPENAAYRQEPGVLLFRKTNVSQPLQDPDLLLILLVGETPTSGVQKQALMRALDAVMELSSSYEITLIGPSFSGSAISLRMALSEWQNSGPPLHNPGKTSLSSKKAGGEGAGADDSGSRAVKLYFVSGSATSPANPALLKFELPPKVAGGYTIKTTFLPLVYADDLLKETFFDYYLPYFGISISKVAIISEASAYGSRFLGKLPPKASGAAKEDQMPAFEASYPMHVSQLRAAYERDERLKAEAAKSPWKEKAVALSLAEGITAGSDILPSYAPGQTASVAELELAHILNTIERQKIRYIVLAGTDTRDKLFLARLIRAHAPNAQLITFESDILYAHPELITDLSGMLVVSTYPLVPASSELLQFPNGAVEGVYNAVTAVLKRDETASSEVISYSRETLNQGQTPPVYISAVGRSRLWPLRFYPETGGAELKRLPTAHPISFWVFVALLTVWCLLHISNYPRGARAAVRDTVWGVRGYSFNIEWRRCSAASPVPTADGALQWIAYRAYVFSYLSVFLILYLLVVMISLIPAIMELKGDPDGRRYLVNLSLLSAAFLLVWALAGIWFDSGVLFVQSLLKEKLRERLRWKGAAAGVVALVIVVAGFWMLFLITKPVHNLLYERATTLGSGLSPIVPLLFLSVGVYFWLLSQLWRHEFADQLQSLNPFPGSPPRESDLSHSRERVLRCLKSWDCGTSPGLAIGSMVLLALLPAVGVGHRVFATFEYRWFNWLAFLLTTILLLCVIRSGLRFLSTWYQFRRLLRRLAWHPIAEAFDRLSPKLSRMLSLQFSARPPSVTELGLSVDQLVLISNHFRTMISQDLSGFFTEAELEGIKSVLQGTEDIKETFEKELKDATERRLRTSAWCSETQRKLFSLSSELMKHLWLHWERRPGKSLLPDDPKSVPLNVDSATLYRRAVSSFPQFWFRLLEDFCALQITFFASCVFSHLKNLLICSTVGGVLLILALTSYPFQQQQVLVSVIWIALAILVTMVLTVFIQMDRNEVLSRIANTEPNRLSLDRRFLSQVFTYAVLPVATFLAAQFPALGRFLFSWISPAFSFLS
ncbi:MAG TPA: hypothetical protein VGK99_03715 [Acidobacteriota bacterium]|jgi:hypothetical protein